MILLYRYGDVQCCIETCFFYIHCIKRCLILMSFFFFKYQGMTLTLMIHLSCRTSATKFYLSHLECTCPNTTLQFNLDKILQLMSISKNIVSKLKLKFVLSLCLWFFCILRVIHSKLQHIHVCNICTTCTHIITNANHCYYPVSKQPFQGQFDKNN